MKRIYPSVIFYIPEIGQSSRLCNRKESRLFPPHYLQQYEKKMMENAEELTKQQIELDAVALEKQKLIDEMNELKGVKTEKKSQNHNSPR